MLVKTKAIILHAFRYGESQMIVDLLSETEGRLSVITHVSSSPRARIRKQFFQPLTVVEVVIDKRRNSSLHRLKEVRIAIPFASIPISPFKLSISLFIAEFLCNAIREEFPDAGLYKYVENSILWLDGVERDFSNFHLVFMLRLSRFVGFFPNLDGFAPDSFFDLRNGCFTISAPLHSNFLQPADASRIITMMRMNYDTMHLFTMSHHDRNRCVDTILDYYRLHVPGFKEMKSLPVLKEIFAD